MESQARVRFFSAMPIVVERRISPANSLPRSAGRSRSTTGRKGLNGDGFLKILGTRGGERPDHTRACWWLHAPLIRPFSMRRLVFILGAAVGLPACTQPREPATVDSVALPPVPETPSSSPGPSPAAVAADTVVKVAQAQVDSAPFRSIYEKPFNDTLTLSAAVRWRDANFTELELRVSLIPRQRDKEAWIIAQRQDRNVEAYEILRTDDTSVVIGRNGFYHSMPSLKLFLHPQSKSVVKQIEYGPHIGLGAIHDREVGRLLEVPPEIVAQLKKKPWEEKPDSTHLPAELRKHPMPPSTYEEFARARPRRVANGYGPDDTVLEEQPGPYQIAGSRIWFGKVFYDGEGHSGVGGLGYFDTGTSQYGFLQVPELDDWSVSAILVEEDAAWIGLAGHPEGEDYGGGLIRYDFKSGTSRKLLTEELVHHIVRWKDRVYVATENGAYVVQENRLVKRYRVEPNIDNQFIIVSENLPPR